MKQNLKLYIAKAAAESEFRFFSSSSHEKPSVDCLSNTFVFMSTLELPAVLAFYHQRCI